MAPSYPPGWTTSHLNKTKYKGAAGSNRPRFVVLHGTGGDYEGDLKVLRGLTDRKVSCHFYVTQLGSVHYIVSVDRAAWHAGLSAYGGEIGLNDASIGIELENKNDGKDPYTEAQLDALDNLFVWLDARIGEKPIVTHAQIATPRGRKVDPVRFLELPDFVKYRDHDPDEPDEWRPNSAPMLKRVINCKVLNVRKTPNTKHKEIHQLKADERVIILGRSGKWYKIKHGKIVGYCHSHYLG